MKNPNYVVLISKAPNSSFEVFSVSANEPTNQELRNIWEGQGLKEYGQCSDLIEVYLSTQLAEAFLENFQIIAVGQVLNPNPMSTQDAINAYFP